MLTQAVRDTCVMKHSDLTSVDEKPIPHAKDDVRALLRMLTWAEQELEALSLTTSQRNLREAIQALMDETGIHL